MDKIKVYVLTSQDQEYGYDIFETIARSPEELLEWAERYKDDEKDIISLGFNNTQIVSRSPGSRYYWTLYFIDEFEL